MPARIVLACVLFLLAFVAAPGPAHACGVSGPDGVWSCSLEEHDELLRRRWHVGASGVYTATALDFGSGRRADEQRNAALATLAYAPTPQVTLQAAAGATFGGALTLKTGRYDFDPGPTAALGASWRVVMGRPFVVLTSTLSFSAATTHGLASESASVRYQAFDLRLGAAVGTTVLDVLSPYLVGRVFGGPVFWRYQGSAVVGTDVSHVQLGLGLALLIAQRLDVFVEGIPLGEQALSGGLSIAF